MYNIIQCIVSCFLGFMHTCTVIESMHHTLQCFFQDFDEGGGGQKYVNTNWGGGGGGACNRGAKRLMTHFVGHMHARGCGGMLPQNFLPPEISFPANCQYKP